MKKLIALGLIATTTLTACMGKSSESFMDNVMGAMTQVTNAKGSMGFEGTVKLKINGEYVNTVDGDILTQETGTFDFAVLNDEHVEMGEESGFNMEFFDEDQYNHDDNIEINGTYKDWRYGNDATKKQYEAQNIKHIWEQEHFDDATNNHLAGITHEGVNMYGRLKTVDGEVSPEGTVYDNHNDRFDGYQAFFADGNPEDEVQKDNFGTFMRSWQVLVGEEFATTIDTDHLGDAQTATEELNGQLVGADNLRHIFRDWSDQMGYATYSIEDGSEAKFTYEDDFKLRAFDLVAKGTLDVTLQWKQECSTEERTNVQNVCKWIDENYTEEDTVELEFTTAMRGRINYGTTTAADIAAVKDVIIGMKSDWITA